VIPDFVELRKELELEARLYLHSKGRSDGLFAQMRSRTQHEGKKHSFTQIGVGVVESDYKEFAEKIELTVEETTQLVGDKLRQKLDEIATGMQTQMSKHFFQTFEEQTSKVGNSIDAKGEPFSQELFLAMIEKTEMDFDENKKPRQTLVMHPDMAEKLIPIGEAWEKDPEFQKRHAEILSRKYEDFRARESSRKLVS